MAGTEAKGSATLSGPVPGALVCRTPSGAPSLHMPCAAFPALMCHGCPGSSAAPGETPFQFPSTIRPFGVWARSSYGERRDAPVRSFHTALPLVEPVRDLQSTPPFTVDRLPLCCTPLFSCAAYFFQFSLNELLTSASPCPCFGGPLPTEKKRRVPCTHPCDWLPSDGPIHIYSRADASHDLL